MALFFRGESRYLASEQRYGGHRFAGASELARDVVHASLFSAFRGGIVVRTEIQNQRTVSVGKSQTDSDTSLHSGPVCLATAPVLL